MGTERFPGPGLAGLVMLGQLAAPLAVAQSTSLMNEVDASLPALDGRRTAASNAPEPASGQQRGGRLPSLPRLFALALENDAELASQRYDAQATAQQVPMAEAGLKPQVSASAGYTYQESDNYYTDNPAYNPDNELSGASDDYDARYRGVTRDESWQVQLSQPLFSLERWRRVDKAEAQSDAAQLQVAVAERDLALQVAEAYLDAFLASRKLGLLASKRESLTLQVKQAQRAYDLGIGDRINLLESQARLDQAVADAVRAENELDNALSSLERLTGTLPQFAGSRLGDLSQVTLPGDWDAAEPWLERTVNNLEVALGKQRMEIARADTGVRRAGHYPELNLNLAYSDRASNDPYRESEDASASLRLNVPIYQGGYTSASVRQGELAQRASRAAYTHALNLTRQEIRQRLRSLHGSERQVEALKRSIESSRLFLQAAEKGEQLGLRDLVDVLDARANLYDLRIQFVRVIRQYLLDRLNLQAAVGDLGTQDLVDSMALLNELVASPS